MTDPIHNSWTIARSALLTHQHRLSVTANNIANVDTPGYRRQQVLLSPVPETPPALTEARTWSNGAGVRVTDVVRAYNEMTVSLLRQQASDANGHRARADALSSLETLMYEEGNNSLSGHLDAFWNAWYDVSNQADNMAARAVTIQRGVNLADHIRNLNSRIDAFGDQIISGAPGSFTGQLPNDVNQFNRLTEELQDLNTRIYYSSHFQPHALQDRRDVVLREMSELAHLTVGAGGEVSLDGKLVVSANGQHRSELTVADAGPPPELFLAGEKIEVSSGRLSAWTGVLGIAESLRDRLDLLAFELATAVNSIHNSDLNTEGDSYDLQGDRCVINFFEGSTAATIAVENTLYDPANPMGIAPHLLAAAASRYDDGPPPIPNTGDGARALQIADLAQATRSQLNGQGFGAFHTTGLALLGGVIATEEALADDGDAIVSALEDVLQAETAVNLDEELMNMVLAQRAFQAAARALQTIDEMMQTILQS